jgi:hypothetical protein
LNEEQIEAFKRRPLGGESLKCTANMSFLIIKRFTLREAEQGYFFLETGPCGLSSLYLQEIGRLGYATKGL